MTMTPETAIILFFIFAFIILLFPSMSQTGLPDGLKITNGQYPRNPSAAARKLHRNQQISANATLSQWGGRTEPSPCGEVGRPTG